MRENIMKRLSGILFLSGALWFAHAALAARPNLILIIADDCTYLDLGVYGGQARTPHLDRLAQQGLKFSRAFQAAPMCSPTRHNIYTGIYPVKIRGLAESHPGLSRHKIDRALPAGGRLPGGLGGEGACGAQGVVSL